MDSALRNRINTILSVARNQDWSDTPFSLLKAHVCAELAAIVYEDVQEYELKKASRIHLFASDAYRNIVQSGKPNNILDTLAEGDFREKFFVIRGRYAVILGTILNDAVILAVRGTVFRRLWDWKANVDAKKYYFSQSHTHHPYEPESAGFEDTFFHRGFFESIVPHFGSISDEIKQRIRDDDDLSIVWTGHSLGGAMAAVGHALSENRLSRWWMSERLPGTIAGAYTFGMPRYCGLGAICSFAGPHHIYQAHDLVPTVPLRRMGFADSSREYEISSSGIVRLTERTDTFDLAGHIPKLYSSIKAHSIDGYANAIAQAVGLPRP